MTLLPPATRDTLRRIHTHRLFVIPASLRDRAVAGKTHRLHNLRRTHKHPSPPPAPVDSAPFLHLEHAFSVCVGHQAGRVYIRQVVVVAAGKQIPLPSKVSIYILTQSMAKAPKGTHTTLQHHIANERRTLPHRAVPFAPSPPHPTPLQVCNLLRCH